MCVCVYYNFFNAMDYGYKNNFSLMMLDVFAIIHTCKIEIALLLILQNLILIVTFIFLILYITFYRLC